LSRKHYQGKLVEEALSRKTCQEKNLLVCKGGFALSEIFRPNRNFLLSYKHSDGTKQKSFEFEPGLNLNHGNFGSIEKFRPVENRLKGHWQRKFLLLHLKEHEKISRLAV
jgi:hypothetical protein